jgi:hypothetical protein
MPSIYIWEWMYISTFFISALDGGEWSASHSGLFTPGNKDTAIHRIGGWVNPRVCPGKRKFLHLSGIKPRPYGLSLYQLSYPGNNIEGKPRKTKLDTYMKKKIRMI